MEHSPAVDALSEAQRLSTQARQAGRWFARYLLVFAIGSFAIALGFAALGPALGASVLTPIWVVFVIVMTLYAGRQRTQVRGANRIQAVMMPIWAVVYAVTILGSFQLDQAVWWWVLGGVAMAIPPMVARSVVLRRIAGQ